MCSGEVAVWARSGVDAIICKSISMKKMKDIGSEKATNDLNDSSIKCDTIIKE